MAKFISNKDLQQQLDKEKWLESEKAGYDKSGDMPYCEHCFYKELDGFCSQPHKERECNSLCAKAYNKSKRKK